MASHSMQAQAYNEATFREPDEDGWQPQHEPIDTHPGCSPDTCLHTRLPLQRVLGTLFQPTSPVMHSVKQNGAWAVKSFPV